MKNTILDKTKLVNSVFSKVYKKYDLMNDIMSFEIHRIWKEKFIDWMNPHANSKLIDVASGTGDIAKLFSKRNNNSSEITCIEPNYEMFEEGKKNLKPEDPFSLGINQTLIWNPLKARLFLNGKEWREKNIFSGYCFISCRKTCWRRDF